MLVIENIKDFNIEHIFDCGQCFRWNKETDGSYTGIAFGKIINLKTETIIDYHDKNESKVNLIFDNATKQDYENIWHHYFDLDRDYGEIKSKLKENDPLMEKAIDYGYGIRILNQDKWEAIISFLISQNNNIPRIKKCIESLCFNFGESAGTYMGKEYFDIPKPEVLSKLSVSDLEVCKLGYRSKYIIETAKKVEMQGIGESFDFLVNLCGVGPKVANCILLFSMKRIDSFPIDVWVRRVMNSLYGIKEEDTKAMTDYAKLHFGEYGGIAQQYLFYYIRKGE